MEKIERITPTPESDPSLLQTRLTVRQFIQRYFAPGARPSSSTVIGWILGGTQEKIYLKATRFDGKYYISLGDAESFMRASTVLTSKSGRINLGGSPSHQRSVQYLRERWGFDIPGAR